MLTREQLRLNYESGLDRARRYFMGDSDVQRAAHRVAAALDDLQVPYVICGALAVTAHGHARLTEDVDLLVTPEGLRRFEEHKLGKGCLVKIHVLLTGDFPGDGRPKPVRFPHPDEAFVDIGGTKILTLAKLVELKLASGMTAPDRPRDLDDVIQLVRANALSIEFAGELDPWVRAKFEELWGYAQIPAEE